MKQTIEQLIAAPVVRKKKDVEKKKEKKSLKRLILHVKTIRKVALKKNKNLRITKVKTKIIMN